MDAQHITAQMERALKAGTPLVAISTPDQQSLVDGLASSFAATPIVQWDAVRGVRPVNAAGSAIVRKTWGDDLQATISPIETLSGAERLPQGALLVILQAHRFVADAIFATGVANLRDLFKSDGRMLLLLGPTFGSLPHELRQDVVIMEEVLPNDEKLAAIIEAIHSSAGIKVPEGKAMLQAVCAVRGLSCFAAEQVVAMSLTKNGLDLDALWERKRVQVNQVKGVTLIRGGLTFAQVGGLENVREQMRRLFNGPVAPNLVVIVEEMEKAMAGWGGNDASRGDSNGIGGDQHQHFLNWMEDKGHTGFIGTGVPGGGKSLIAQCVANEFGVPWVRLDLGAMKGGIVGESEARIREATATIDAIAAGRALIIGTCNGVATLSAPMKRRFKLGVFYFDLLSESEKQAVWKLKRQEYGIDAKDERPDDFEWTGAEIRNCCERARAFACSLKEAAESIVSVAEADPQVVKALREQANGRFLSASYPGKYRLPEQGGGAEQVAAISAKRGRAVSAS